MVAFPTPHERVLHQKHIKNFLSEQHLALLKHFVIFPIYSLIKKNEKTMTHNNDRQILVKVAESSLKFPSNIELETNLTMPYFSHIAFKFVDYNLAKDLTRKYHRNSSP